MSLYNFAQQYIIHIEFSPLLFIWRFLAEFLLLLCRRSGGIIVCFPNLYNFIPRGGFEALMDIFWSSSVAIEYAGLWFPMHH